MATDNNRFSDQPGVFTAEQNTVSQGTRGFREITKKKSLLKHSFTEQLDCGIKQLHCCTGEKFQQYATIRKFILALAFVGLIQGAFEAYFSVSAREAAEDFGYSPVVVGESRSPNCAKKLHDDIVLIRSYVCSH